MVVKEGPALLVVVQQLLGSRPVVVGPQLDGAVGEPLGQFEAEAKPLLQVVAVVVELLLLVVAVGPQWEGAVVEPLVSRPVVVGPQLLQVAVGPQLEGAVVEPLVTRPVIVGPQLEPVVEPLGCCGLGPS